MPLASPPHDLYLLVEGVELAVPRLDVEVEAVPEVRPPRQRRNAAVVPSTVWCASLMAPARQGQGCACVYLQS